MGYCVGPDDGPCEDMVGSKLGTDVPEVGKLELSVGSTVGPTVGPTVGSKVEPIVDATEGADVTRLVGPEDGVAVSTNEVGPKEELVGADETDVGDDVTEVGADDVAWVDIEVGTEETAVGKVVDVDGADDNDGSDEGPLVGASVTGVGANDDAEGADEGAEVGPCVVGSNVGSTDGSTLELF